MNFQKKVLNKMPLGVNGTYSIDSFRMTTTKKAAEDIEIGTFVGLNDDGEIIQLEGKASSGVEVLGIAMLSSMVNSIGPSNTIKAGENVEVCIHGGVYKQIDEAQEIKAGDSIFIESTTGDLKFGDTAGDLKFGDTAPAPANGLRTGFIVIDGNKDSTLEPFVINVISQRL